MRVPVLIRMYKGKLEIYGDGEEFELEIKHNDECKILHYVKDHNRFKPIIIINNGDKIYFKDLIYPYIFMQSDSPERWEVYNINKNKVLKSRKKYLLALTLDSAKKGLFHNVQKDK